MERTLNSVMTCDRNEKYIFSKFAKCGAIRGAVSLDKCGGLRARCGQVVGEKVN